jgi:uncharacterized protein YdhG (YjbR/CyaY superfamily)
MLAARRTKPKTVAAYIAAQPPAVRPILRKIRATVRDAAPAAEEVLSYGIPAYRWNGILVYFAAFRTHIGLYPPIRADRALERTLAPYTGGKGNLRFPLDRPMPYALVARIVRLRARQNREKAETRARTRRAKAARR